jgi:chemotaxis-related protein WspD
MQSQPGASAPATLNDCWNKIGVWGDAICPELVVHTHCRNCPVYSAAAAELLNGEPPAGYLAEWTRHFAREKPVVEKETHSVVLFRIGAEWLALPVTVFKEVSEVKPIHSLPHRRNRIVLGLVNIRGELLICVSLAEMLNLEKTPAVALEAKAHPYLLVISYEGSRLVFPVDEVAGIHHFNPHALHEVPATVSGAMSTYSSGILSWRDKSVGCLNEQLLVYTLNKSLS